MEQTIENYDLGERDTNIENLMNKKNNVLFFILCNLYKCWAQTSYFWRVGTKDQSTFSYIFKLLTLIILGSSCYFNIQPMAWG